MASRAEKTAYSAAFCALAMVLSYVEVLIPFELLIPLPGFKPGLANIAVAATFFIFGAMPAACVSISRILLSALLFGSVTSFCYSLAGGLLAFLALVFWRALLSKLSGFVGMGVVSAAAHNIGQCIVGAIFFGPALITAYLPYLLIFAIITGILTGTLTAWVLEIFNKD